MNIARLQTVTFCFSPFVLHYKWHFAIVGDGQRIKVILGETFHSILR